MSGAERGGTRCTYFCNQSRYIRRKNEFGLVPLGDVSQRDAAWRDRRAFRSLSAATAVTVTQPRRQPVLPHRPGGRSADTRDALGVGWSSISSFLAAAD